MDWTPWPLERIEKRVFEALDANHSYRRDAVMGLPGSFLDQRVFPPLPELARHPWLSTWMANPNHIGCHTLGASEPHFRGTQALEREVVAICAEGLLGAEPDRVDGYVASGGTESNIQALWTFRNALRRRGREPSEVAVVASSDTHYSVAKGADLLGLHHVPVAVDPETRRMTPETVAEVCRRLEALGVKTGLVVLSMGTTMFGTVDRPDDLLPALEAAGFEVLVHVDAAFGGFVYPLTTPEQPLTFADERLVSFTLDAHKMLQAPYGTGIHVIRKGWIEHVLTEEASYVPGLDCTLVGSRSGGNAVAVWMILRAYGRAGGEAFCAELMERTDRLCQGLEERGVRYVREPGMNVVAMRAEHVEPDVAEAFGLVADDSRRPSWWKVVVMDHVGMEVIERFLAALPPPGPCRPRVGGGWPPAAQ